jgi:hypothetical protein
LCRGVKKPGKQRGPRCAPAVGVSTNKPGYQKLSELPGGVSAALSIHNSAKPTLSDWFLTKTS